MESDAKRVRVIAFNMRGDHTPRICEEDGGRAGPRKNEILQRCLNEPLNNRTDRERQAVSNNSVIGQIEFIQRASRNACKTQ